MKKLFLVFLTSLFVFSCGQDKSEPTNSKTTTTEDKTVRKKIIPVSAVEDVDTEVVPKMTFESLEYNFGVITEGEKIEHTFEFKNTGEEPLLILEAKTVCGCTASEYPEDYIQPGKKGKIKVIFDSLNQTGKISKPVTLIANTYPREVKLHMVGEVKKHKH